MENVNQLDTVSEQPVGIDGSMLALVSIAQKYPRKVAKCLDEAKTNCCINEEIASACGYAKPIAGGFIKGPSIRQAEIMASAWGRMMISGAEIEVRDGFCYAEGTCIDVEKMVGWKITKKRPVTDKNGKLYRPDVLANASNGTVSIAMRDAIFRTIGIAYRDDIYEAAMEVASGKQRPIEERRTNALAWFTKLGIATERVVAVFKVSSVDELTDEHLATLGGLRTAIKEGETTIEEAFPPPPAPDGEMHKIGFGKKAAAPGVEEYDPVAALKGLASGTITQEMVDKAKLDAFNGDPPAENLMTREDVSRISAHVMKNASAAK